LLDKILKIDIEDLFRMVSGCFAYGIRVATYTGKELEGRSIFLLFCSGTLIGLMPIRVGGVIGLLVYKGMKKSKIICFIR